MLDILEIFSIICSMTQKHFPRIYALSRRESSVCKYTECPQSPGWIMRFNNLKSIVCRPVQSVLSDRVSLEIAQNFNVYTTQNVKRIDQLLPYALENIWTNPTVGKCFVQEFSHYH
jgi:hypothetical protein